MTTQGQFDIWLNIYKKTKTKRNRRVLHPRCRMEGTHAFWRACVTSSKGKKYSSIMSLKMLPHPLPIGATVSILS